jgi:hypothetical protein
VRFDELMAVELGLGGVSTSSLGAPGGRSGRGRRAAMVGGEECRTAKQEEGRPALEREGTRSARVTGGGSCGGAAVSSRRTAGEGDWDRNGTTRAGQSRFLIKLKSHRNFH